MLLLYHTFNKKGGEYKNKTLCFCIYYVWENSIIVILFKFFSFNDFQLSTVNNTLLTIDNYL